MQSQFSWQVQYWCNWSVIFRGRRSILQCDFSWQAQHLVMSERRFSWQVQHVVKFAVDSGSAKCCNLQKKMRLQSAKVTSANGRVRDDDLNGRIMLGSWSNRPRIGNDTSTIFGKFRKDLGVQFCVAGAVFGEVGG